MFVCPSVGGKWKSKPLHLDEILHAHSYMSKEGFDAGLTPPFPPLGLRPESLKPEGQRCSAGFILTRAAPCTSASLYVNIEDRRR